MSANAPALASEQSQQTGSSSYKPRYIDIGINLTDAVYSGEYHGTQRHPSDLSSVIERGREAGCRKLIVTGSDLKESIHSLELSKAYPGTIYSTIGVHPCSCLQFTTHEPSSAHLLSSLRTLALEAKASGHCVAFGEIGLDYDRLTLCPKDVQLEYFAAQLDVAVEVGLPLFLHSRAAHADFIRLLKEREEKLPKKGVVHSFTGTMEEMQELVEEGWSVGVNGCSLKTTENLEVVKAIPLDKIMLETDGPWCEIRPSHASAAYVKDFDGDKWKWVKKEKWVDGALVKGRNEPCMIGKVAWAVAGIKGISVEELVEAAWANTVAMFKLED
ncbi:Uncharacterized protein BP5553_05411 [Venustampulla echinocandica]|uniref:Uncharacterized protein n=1 Tax=Venustampulla echinocandica TaxID=2656787 RepID=A0A370TR40_9HELO|nr:Uncharacterized protein BP5553_05411 [Venustampulla echinocandica]RDL37978.1 Uncharacterized protein BP5553_05411 [Venustampulla echinocandica]